MTRIRHCVELVLSRTSLQYWTRMSLNFCIIWLLMASLERMCLNLSSMSKAADAERRVLKDWSMKLMASASMA